MRADNLENGQLVSGGGSVWGYLGQLGVLRLMLLTAALVVAAFAFLVTPVEDNAWAIIRGAVMPAAAPILFMLLLLDTLMARVWLGEAATPAERSRWRRVIGTNLGVTALLGLSWAPFFYALFTF